MCIGVPMQINKVDGLVAVCANEEEEVYGKVDLSLIGEQSVGTWVVAFLGSAREVIDPGFLPELLDARRAMRAIQNGENIDDFFQDLVDRKPELPDFLKTT